MASDDTTAAANGSERLARTVAPFGSWASPFPISRLTEGAVALPEVHARGGVRWWLEGRPEEGGRQVLVRRDPDGTVSRLTPEGFNARTRVHEYGGAAVLISDELILVSEFRTGRLHRVVQPDVVEPLTPERAWRFADGVIDTRRGRALYVREDHDPETLARHGQAENAIVAVDLASGEVTRLVTGSDFYAAPRLSPDGLMLAWLEWDHPNMPWDGTRLRLAEVAPDGTLGTGHTVAGSASDWVSQPRWSPDGSLHFLAEDTGWMNLYRLVGGRVEPVAILDAEIATPDWLFGGSRYAFDGEGGIVFVARAAGRDRLYRLAPGAGPRSATLIDLPYVEIPNLAVDGMTVVMRAGTPSDPAAIVDLDLRTGSATVLRRSAPPAADPDDISVGRPVEFPTTHDRTAFGVFYAPHNRRFEAPPGELPPLVVTSHGGPTSSAWVGYSTLAQLFATRGFAVLDVDYGGSTGYGRDYRKRLEGEWGVVDVDDCVAGARWLAEQGLADGSRQAIRGASASGYTTLCAVTFTDAFDAGVSMFGLGDLETFVKQTHKFESRYLDRLVGPYPEAKELYRERSPLNFADRISCPVLIEQGLEDRIVPPAQAEEIVDVLWERRIPHAYLAFPGEDHGFRSKEAILKAFESELSFYGQVFGFEPADSIERLDVAFLGDRGPAKVRPAR